MLIAASLLLLSAPIAAAQSGTRFEQWLTIIGGGPAEIVTVDSQGRIYAAGTAWDGLPTTSNAVASAPATNAFRQGFLLVLDPSGTSVLYGTFLNGVRPRRIAVDVAGHVYVLGDHAEPGSGRASSPAPITPTSVQTSPGWVSTPVLLKIAPSGELVYGTFLGGLSSVAGGLAVDSRGAAILCGSTADPNLPVTRNAVQPQLRGQVNVYVARLSPDGSRFEALTYLGGHGSDYCEDVKIDFSGNVFVYGDTNSRFFPVTSGAYQTAAKGLENLFIAKLDSDFRSLVWSTYLGGRGSNWAKSMTFAPEGGLFLAGSTDSPDFPVAPGTSPACWDRASVDLSPAYSSYLTRPFLATLDPSGARLISAHVLPFEGAFLGTSDGTSPFFASGWARSRDLVDNATFNAVDMADLRVGDDPLPFLLRFDPIAQAPTYLGFLRNVFALPLMPVGVATGSNEDVIIAGWAPKYDFPGIPVRSVGQGPESAVVFSLRFSSERLPLVTQVVNPASLMPSPASPGQLIEIRGSGLGSTDTTRVLLDGVPVPALAVSSTAILTVAPSPLAGRTSFTLVVERDAVASDPRSVPVAAVNPALFTAANTGSGQALATNEDGSPNSPQRPALKGRSLRLFATGLGALDAFQRPRGVVTAQLSGLEAAIRSIGSVPGRPEGYLAVDVVVPAGAPQGDFVPIRITADGAQSQCGVTVALR